MDERIDEEHFQQHGSERCIIYCGRSGCLHVSITVIYTTQDAAYFKQKVLGDHQLWWNHG